jgi:hypothetical protein
VEVARCAYWVFDEAPVVDVVDGLALVCRGEGDHTFGEGLAFRPVSRRCYAEITLSLVCKSKRGFGRRPQRLLEMSLP